MPFTERVQQLCDTATIEQVNELREFLAEFSDYLEDEPALMAMSLRDLAQEATDQGYNWDTVVLVLQHVAMATAAGEQADRITGLIGAYMTRERSLADLSAELTDIEPNFTPLLIELVEEARQEHRALNDLAGGHSVTKALASPWNKNSNLNKKQRTAGEIAEVGLGVAVGAGVIYGGKVGISAIYAAGEKRQYWGEINTKIGGKDGFTMREMINKDLTATGRFISPDDHGKAFNDLLSARDKLVQKSGKLTPEQEDRFYHNARSVFAGVIDDDNKFSFENSIETLLNPNPAIREIANDLNTRFEKDFVLPERLRGPLENVDKELIAHGIKVEELDVGKLSDVFMADPKRPTIDNRLLPPSEWSLVCSKMAEAKIGLALEFGVNDANDKLLGQHPTVSKLMRELNDFEVKASLMEIAETTNRSLPEVIEHYKGCTVDKDILEQQKQELIKSDWIEKNFSRTGNLLYPDKDPAKNENFTDYEKDLFMTMNKMSLSPTFRSDAQAFEREMDKDRELNSRAIAREGGKVFAEDVNTVTDIHSEDLYELPRIRPMKIGDSVISNFRGSIGAGGLERAEPIDEMDGRRLTRRLEDSDLGYRVSRPRANSAPNILPSNPERDLISRSFIDGSADGLSDLARNDADEVLSSGVKDAQSDISSDIIAEENVVDDGIE